MGCWLAARTSLSIAASAHVAAAACSLLCVSVVRILTKVDGVQNIDADVEAKKLVVTGTADKEVITEKLAKWSAAAGKEVRFVKEL